MKGGNAHHPKTNKITAAAWIDAMVFDRPFAITDRLVAPDPTLSLQEQAIWSMGYQFDSTGDHRIPAYAQLLPYEGAGALNSYVVESISGYSITFLGTYDGCDRLLEVTARCDCGIPIEAVTDLLR